MPLKIDLKEGEKIAINGAVMTAGRGGASIILQNEATLLRGRDILQEEEATTPAKRIYFMIQLMYIDPEQRSAYAELYGSYVRDLRATSSIKEVHDALDNIDLDVAAGNYYRAMKTCKAVIAVETELLKIANGEQP
jgi:flagellar protein FlbT